MKIMKNAQFGIPQSIRIFTVTLFAFSIILMAMPQKNFAYEKETHFWFTYYLAVKVGYTHVQAMQVASADVSVDFDKDTVPEFAAIRSFSSFLHPQDHFQDVRVRFHALAHKSTVMKKSGSKTMYWFDPQAVKGEQLKVADELVRERRDAFWAETIGKPENPGAFLHYMQDMYPHRGFLSYVGHPGYYYADFIASDMEKADQMAFETIRYLIAFREVYFEKKPAVDFLNVQAIDINDYLNEDTIAEIRNTLRRFAEANPSPGRTKNVLVDNWLALDENERSSKSYRIPPTGSARAMLEVKENYRGTDSSKSKKVVKSVLGYESAQMPDIWIYNLTNRTKNGMFKKDRTDDVMIYLELPDRKDSPNGILTKVEASNTRRGMRNDDKRRKLCLPAALVDKKINRVPLCK